MAVSVFVPEIWSVRLLSELQKVHVAANLVNRDYEGEIKGPGETLHICTLLNDISVWDYESYSEMLDPENLNMTDCCLDLAQAKYFNFIVDDMDAIQAAGNVMDKAIEVNAHVLKNYSDEYILETLANEADESNFIGGDSPIAITTDNIYSYIIQLRTLLDKNNAPYEDRAVIIPPEACGLLLHDTRFLQANPSDERVKSGYIGVAAGIDVYVSNNVFNDGDYYFITAHSKSACTFAEQILKMDAYRPENYFSDAVKGLYVYGAKVTQPLGVACLVCSIG